ncbi:ras-related protein Rap-2b-like [Glandiceps talaboti]
MPRSRSLRAKIPDDGLNLKESKRLVVMGATGVGKSSIISRFLYGKFSEQHKETVEEMHAQDFNISGHRLHLEVLDTSGSFSFPAMQKIYIETGDVFVLVYSVTNKDSFEEIVRLRNLILDGDKKNESTIIVVGNKSDLEDDRQVNYAFADLLAGDWDLQYIETSAKTNSNIEDLFEQIFKSVKLPGHVTNSILQRQRKLCPDSVRSAQLQKQSRNVCVIS